MKLLSDISPDINYIAEAREDLPGAPKKYYVEGIFMQADRVNQNKRIYPKLVLESEVNRFNTSCVVPRSAKAMGELGHPTNPNLNMERVSHIITELRCSGSDVIGKAEILDTAYGKIVQEFIDRNIQLGVSSRAIGSVKTMSNGINEVQNDFRLITVDIVADPSAPDAFVQGIVENKEWVCNNGVFTEKQLAHVKNQLKNKSPRVSTKDLEAKLFEDVFNFLKHI
jgi:hypothetical protein